MEPLRLTWELSSPMASGPHPLHLDGLLAYAIVEEAIVNGSIGDRDPRTLREVATGPLPLGRDERDGHWCWQASVLRPRDGARGHSMRYWTRRTDEEDYAARAEAGQIHGRFKFPKKEPYGHAVHTDRGLFKQLFKFFPVQDVPVVEAWCIGDMEHIDALLHPDSGYVTHIGAKTRMGLGKVKSFTVERDPLALTNWKRRVTPWPQDGAVATELAARPPYWAIENRQMAWVDPVLLT